MIGVLGVSPKEGDIGCAVPGDHGANLDTKLIKVGTKVFLPVAVDYAGLAVGDLHACMGDGELSGTGIETAGRVCLRTTVRNDITLKRPMLETEDSIYTLSSSPDMKAAIYESTNDMVSYLMKKKSLNFPDAYRLLSAACDIQISQVVNDALTVRVRAPKFNLQLSSI
jgi:amidase